MALSMVLQAPAPLAPTIAAAGSPRPAHATQSTVGSKPRGSLEPPAYPAGSPVRARLLALVHGNPGLSMSQARDGLGVAWGTMVHHVRRLEREGLLATQAHGRCVGLFAAGLAPAHFHSAAILHDDQAGQVLRILGQERQASLVGLGRALGVSRKVARRLVRGLLAAGLIENAAEGRPRYVLVARPPARAPLPVYGRLHALQTPEPAFARPTPAVVLA